MLHVSAWLNVSLDPVHGNKQRSSTYWNRIRKYWMAKKKFTSDRSSNSLLHRWSGIQLSINKFYGYMAKIEGRSQSGVNEKDRLSKPYIYESQFSLCKSYKQKKCINNSWDQHLCMSIVGIY